MNTKLAELKVKKSADYNDKVVKALENAGFVIVQDLDTTSDSYYTVAENMDESEDE